MVIANSYSMNGDLYQFNFDDGNIKLYPQSAVILIRDDSEYISVKLVANNETIILIKQ